MRILHIGLSYFKMTQHVGIAFRVRSLVKGIQTIQMGYFEAIMHVGIAFRVDSSFELAIFALILLPIGILGFPCNTCTHTSFYQLEFWGFLTIPALIPPFTNWNFGVSLQYLLLPTRILGFNCNTCTCTYLYQLGFWGLITTPAININHILIARSLEIYCL